MAIIKRPDTSGSASLRPVGEAGASSAASGAVIGAEVSNVGRAISRSSQQYFNAATRSLQEAQYTNAIADTTKDFNTQYEQRLSQRLDDDGNPNFQTLAEDTGLIGKDIRDEASAKIFDPAVKAKYIADFDKHVSNQQVLALSEARKQHLDYSRVSIQKGVESFTQQALLGDPANVQHHIERIQGIIDGGLQGGIITAQQAESLSSGSKSNILVGSMQRIIEANPEMAKEQLDQGPEALGLTVQQHSSLVRQNEAAQRDIDRQASRQEAEENRVRSEQQNLNKGELELGLIQGLTGEKEIEEAADREDISPTQRISLLKQLFKNEKRLDKSQSTSNTIDTAITNESPILDATASQIGDHYNTRVTGISEPGPEGQPGQAPSLLQKAKLASDYVAPVRPFQKELAFNLEFGSAQQAVEAVRAWEHTDVRQPIALQGLDRDAAAIAVATRNILTHTTSSDADAIRTAREQVLDKSEETRKLRIRKFNNISDFKPEEIEETVADMFDADAFLGFGGANVDQGVLPVMSRLLREAYVQTGNTEDAKDLVKAQTNALYGESEFNKDEGILDDTETFMFMPPEKVFPGVAFEDLRSDLEVDIVPFIPSGFTAKDVRIQSDSLTRSDTRNPSWSTYVLGEAGEEIPITNPKTGNVVRWVPDYNAIVERRRTSGLESMRKERQEATSDTVEIGGEPVRVSPTAGLRGGRRRSTLSSSE